MPSKEKYWGDLIREMYQALKKRLPTTEEMNEAYWKLRTDEIDKTVAKLQKEVYKEMSQAYVETFREIAKETNNFLMKYANILLALILFFSAKFLSIYHLITYSINFVKSRAVLLKLSCLLLFFKFYNT